MYHYLREKCRSYLRRKTQTRERFPRFQPTVETLETRVCPSVFYDFNIIAKTGDLNLTGMGDFPSINDAGQVAFVGQFSDGEGLMVGNGSTGSLRNFNPGFSHTSTRNFGRGVQINNNNQVVAVDLVPAGPDTRLRIWDANGTDAFSILARGGNSFLDDYDAILRPASINNNGKVVFSALSGTNIILATPALIGFNEQTFANQTILRPAIDDLGDVVVQAGNQPNSPILLYGPGLVSPVAIAKSGDFATLGRSSGISDDGQIVTFYGDLTANGASALSSQQPGLTALRAYPNNPLGASISVYS